MEFTVFAEFTVFHVVATGGLGEAQLPNTRMIVKIDIVSTALLMRNGKADQGSTFTRCSDLDILELWPYSVACA